MGYNRGLRHGVSGFGGLAICHFCYEAFNTSGFLDLAIAVAPRFDLEAGLLAGPGRESANWGTSLGGRIYVPWP